jgi:hypothetical protein
MFEIEPLAAQCLHIFRDVASQGRAAVSSRFKEGLGKAFHIGRQDVEKGIRIESRQHVFGHVPQKNDPFVPAISHELLEIIRFLRIVPRYDKAAICLDPAECIEEVMTTLFRHNSVKEEHIFSSLYTQSLQTFSGTVLRDFDAGREHLGITAAPLAVIVLQNT